MGEAMPGLDVHTLKRARGAAVLGNLIPGRKNKHIGLDRLQIIQGKIFKIPLSGFYPV